MTPSLKRRPDAQIACPQRADGNGKHRRIECWSALGANALRLCPHQRVCSTSKAGIRSSKLRMSDLGHERTVVLRDGLWFNLSEASRSAFADVIS